MDGLSGAASVAGILSLAESIQKLCKLLSAFRSASEDVEDIVDDLEVLTYVLADIQRCEELFGPQHATTKAILRCRRQVQALEKMVAGWKEDFEQGNRWRRGQAAAKVVIKTEKVKEWRVKISEAKETLSLALQASSSRVQYTQLMTVARVEGQMTALNGQASYIQTLVEADSRGGFSSSSLAHPAAADTSVVSSASASYTLQPAYTRSRRTRSQKPWFRYSSWSQNTWSHGLLGTVKCQTQRTGKPASEEEELVDICFQPSWWLQKLGFNTIFEVQVERSSRFGWKASLQVEHLLPPEASKRARIAIGNNNIQDLIDMFSTGVIGIHSLLSPEHGLLDYAARFARSETCTMLFQAGLQPRATSGCAAFHMISLNTEPSSSKLMTMRAFVDGGQDVLDLNIVHTALMIGNFTTIDHHAEDDTPSEELSCWLLDHLTPDLKYQDEETLARFWPFTLGKLGVHPKLEPTDSIRRAFSGCKNISYKRVGLLYRLCDPMAKSMADLWLNELGSLHFMEEDALGDIDGPLSFWSMEEPSRLANLQSFLASVEIPIEEFVKGEIPLLRARCGEGQDAWTEETLLNFLTWDLEDTFEVKDPHKNCRRCKERAWPEERYNALWILGGWRIWHGRSVDGPFEKGEEDQEKVYRRWRRYFERWREEGICRICQDKEEAEEHFNPSPFLLDI